VLRRGTDSTVVGGELTEYAGLWPRQHRRLRLPGPLPAAQFRASALQNGNLVWDARYATTATVDRFDARGNVLEMHRAHDVPTAYLWGHGASLLVAKAQRATAQQLAYTSFEPGSSGRWVYDTTAAAGLSATSRTGNWAYPLHATRAVTSRPLPAGTYDVQFWSTGPVRVTAGGQAAATTARGTGPGGVATPPRPGPGARQWRRGLAKRHRRGPAARRGARAPDRGLDDHLHAFPVGGPDEPNRPFGPDDDLRVRRAGPPAAHPRRAGPHPLQQQYHYAGH
jgi:hypothetical protein